MTSNHPPYREGLFFRMDLSEFDYHLPPDLIAQVPAEERDQSRLMVVDRDQGSVTHSRFRALPDFLRRGDLLVLNDTQVIPARLLGKKEETGGAVEILLLERISPSAWRCMFKRGKRVAPGTRIVFEGGELCGTVVGKVTEGRGMVEFDFAGDFFEVLKRWGQVPLPPYIKPKSEKAYDHAGRYQTLFAQNPGSSAAPTAGLHFTDQVFRGLASAGVRIATVTLHVGPGTFLPIRTPRIEDHQMEPERYNISAETREVIARAVQDENRIIPVGSTSLRVLESFSQGSSSSEDENGATDLFIYPGYKFRRASGLVTNFHLPQSTLFVLVCALAGTSLMKRTYEEAVRERYRFYSYGDAMVIL